MTDTRNNNLTDDDRETAESIRESMFDDAAGEERVDHPSSAHVDETPPVDEATALRQEVEQWKDKYLRSKAELQNALRRAENEQRDAIRYANASLLRSVIDVADDLDRTIEASAADHNIDSVVEGVRLIRDKLEKFMADQNVTAVEAEGQPFDPARHEALMRQPSADHEPGAIIQQVQKGYMMHDRVLRPAKVIVAAAPAESGEGD